MTTRPDHHEPLDAEERDLAARLGRVGPFEGPSSALDARILAAAHAAAATRVPSRRRHFAWLGVPPALVTGVGVAAAAVLALGLVWQMRPQYGAIPARGEADAEEEVILVAPMGAPSAPVANPPPVPAAPVPAAPAERASAAARADDNAAAPASAKALASAPAATEPVVSDQAGALAAQGVAPAEEERAADTPAKANDGFVAEPPVAAAEALARRNRATYTTAARATATRAAAERREQASKAAPAVAGAPAPAPAAAPPAVAESASDTAAPESDAATLDRIEVTGSRVRGTAQDWSEIPISEDSRLTVDEWLQRIRARRDDGDMDQARASLRLFQRQHPRVRLPADLRKLLTDAKR
jgi:hypothetical protein